MRYFCVFLFLLFIAGKIPAQQIINLEEKGLRPNTFANLSPVIRAALEECKGKSGIVFRLPGGRIDLWPDGSFKKELYISNTTENDTLSKVKNIAFLLDNCQNITIDGNNTLVMLHGKMESFVFLNSTNITLKNISFDYERPTMSEMKILSVTDNEVKAEVHPDSRYFIANGKIGFYGEGWKSNAFHTITLDPQTGAMRYSSFQPLLKSQARETGCREVTFTGDFKKSGYRPGLVLTVRDPYRDNSGAFIRQSRDILLENVKMHYMHGLGIVSQFSENISLRKVTVAPRPESGRIISAFADCFHFSGCKGNILIDSCLTSGSHDDPVNVHGTHLKITRVLSENKLVVRFMHHQTYGFEAFFAGDSVAFVNPQTLQLLALGKIKTARLLNLREMELETNDKLPDSAKEGNVIENLSWTPSVTIRDSRFERTNTRGLLITTRGKVLIENNTFYRTGMHGIFIADDASSWYESGPVRDVTIRNNVFDNCAYNQVPGNYIISIAPENHQLVKNQFVHRNIRIEDNTFISFDHPVLTARSVENLVFTGNKFVRSDFLPGGDSRPAFNLTACTKVLIIGNKFPAGWNSSVLLNDMTSRDIKTDLIKK